MQELGGIPGIGLALGADAFVAPITEVSASTAIILQEELFEAGNKELGTSYLRAIGRDRAVTLYNIYGNPYEGLRGVTDSSTLARRTIYELPMGQKQKCDGGQVGGNGWGAGISSG